MQEILNVRRRMLAASLAGLLLVAAKCEDDDSQGKPVGDQEQDAAAKAPSVPRQGNSGEDDAPAPRADDADDADGGAAVSCLKTKAPGKGDKGRAKQKGRKADAGSGSDADDDVDEDQDENVDEDRDAGSDEGDDCDDDADEDADDQGDENP